MNRTQLAQELIRYRFTRNGIAMGMDIGNAAMLAEQHVRNAGLFGLLAKVKAMGTPEGALIVMVETYLQKFKELLGERPDLLQRKDTSEAERWFSRCRYEAAGHVESFRNHFYQGQPEYPTEIHEYVAYRIDLEMRQLHRVEAAEMGLDRDAIFYMVDEVKQQVLGLEDRPQRQPSPPIPRRAAFGRRRA